MPYIIKYTDGSYNFMLGHPCNKWEATRYQSWEEAGQVADDLTDVAQIEKVDE